VDSRKAIGELVAKMSESDDKSQKSIGRFISRCIACHNNSWEALALFAAGVLAVKAVGVSGDLVKQLGMAFVAIRILYIALYLGGTTQTISLGRTLTWVAGVVVCFTMMVMAARKATADELESSS